MYNTHIQTRCSNSQEYFTKMQMILEIIRLNGWFSDNELPLNMCVVFYKELNLDVDNVIQRVCKNLSWKRKRRHIPLECEWGFTRTKKYIRFIYTNIVSNDERKQEIYQKLHKNIRLKTNCERKLKKLLDF